MNYTKPALSFEQQGELLIRRGLIVEDKESFLRCLHRVNYYRLSAYWYPYKQIDPTTGDESFKPATTFEMIWRLYSIDRELRLLLMDAIEQIEVALLRTLMVEQFTLLHGPFCYCDPKNFKPNFQSGSFNRLLKEIDAAVLRSKEEFVTRYRTKYSSERYLPLWIVVETMTFGQLFTVFQNMHLKEQKILARQFDLFQPVLESWLHSLNFVRNACAHHARLWNRVMPIRPFLPKRRHHSEWYEPVSFQNDRIFAVLTLLQYLLNYINPGHNWKEQLELILNKYPGVPIHLMGFPNNWLECPVWK